MAKLIPIITKLDNSQSNRELDSLEKRFRNLSTITTQQHLNDIPVGFDTRQFQAQASQIQNISTSTAEQIKSAFEINKPTISHYRDLDAAEKSLTATVEKGANAQKFARQVAATQAYEKQVELSNKTTSVLTANTKKLLIEEGKAWDAMLADNKRYEKSSLETNALIAESEKALANVKKTLAKQTNEIEIAEIKKRQAAEKQNNSKGFLTTASEIASVVTAIGVGTQVVTGFVRSVIGYGESLLNLARESSAYANEIYKVQERTGLAAETITTLRYAAEQTGVEFKELTQPLNYFANRLGAAAKGSDEARAKMKALGVTNFNDLEGSLDQVFKRIEALPPGVQRMTAATDAFGEDAASKLIPIIDKTKGNFTEFKKEAEKLGITMSDSSLKAGRDFTLSYNRMSSLATSLINQFSLSLAPELTDSMDRISAGLSRNKDKFKEWGEEVGQVIRGIKELATSNGGQSLKGILEGYLYYTNFALVKAIEFLQKTGADAQAEEIKKWVRVYQTPISERGKEGVDWMKFPRKNADTTDYTNNFDLAKKGLTEDSSIGNILDAMRRGTISQESGGRLGVQNGRTGATGLFQVMPQNIPSWTKATLGQSLTVEQFKASPEAQIAVFNKYMGEYLEAAVKLAKGNKDIAIRMAAAAWYGGEGKMSRYDDPTKFRADEPSFREYTTSVLGKTKQALRLGTKTDINTEKIREQLTQAQKDAAVEALETIYQKTGMLPTEDAAKLIADLRNRKAALSNRLSANLNSSDVISEYKSNQPAVEVAAPTGTSIINTFAERKLTADQEYVKNLRISLGLESERSDQANRYTNLILRQNNLAEEINAKQESYNLALQEAKTDIEVEYRLLSQRNLALEASVKFSQLQNDQYRDLMDIEVDLNVLHRQNADDQFTEQRRLLAAKREQYDLENQITNLQDEIANSGINDSLKIQEAHLRDILDLRNRELDAVIAVNRAQLEVNQAMQISNNQIRAGVYEHLAQQKTINEAIADGINGTFDAVLKKLNSGLDKLNEKTKGFLSFLIEPAKALQANILSRVTASIVDALFPPDIAQMFKLTGNPVLDENKKQTNYLEKIYGVLSGNPLSSGGLSSFGSIGSSGGGISGLIHQILNGGSSSGGVNGTYGGGMDENGIFSYNGFGIGGGASAEAGASGSIWQNLRNLFSTKEGGIFQAQPNLLNGGKPSALGGILNGAGGLATLVGGMIGGRWGGAISMAGTGMQIGSMFGPWGAAIGGAAGFLIGLFSNSQRKADEKARTQYKVDTLSALDQLIKQLNARPPQIQASAAQSQLDDIIKQYTQAASALKDKKTRRIALNELSANEAIGYRKSQVEQAISGAKLYEARAAAAQDLYSRILPEFAGGVYMDSAFRNQFDSFKRYNGMMPGSYTGRDYIRALIGDGEMVINEPQRLDIIRRVGFDPFENIPNYTPQSSPVPKFAEGVSFAATPSVSTSPQINLAPQFNITFENVTPMPGAKMILDTPEGKKEIYDIVEDGFANGKIKLKKR